MTSRACVSVLALGALAACSSSGHPVARPSSHASPSPSPSVSSAPPESASRRVIAEYGGGLVSLDPVTLRQERGSRVRLNRFPVSQVLSPDGRTIAFGAVSHGTITTVDPATFTRTGVMKVLHQNRGTPQELLLVSWPTEHLIVGVAQSYLAHQLFAGRLLLIDPGSRDVRRRVPLRGMAIAESSASDGTAIVLVGDIHDTGPGRLVIVDPRGHIRAVRLPAIKAGANTEADTQSPGLVVHGRTAYIVGEGEAVTTVDLDSLRVVSHPVPGLMIERVLPLAPPMPPGSGGIYRGINRSVVWSGRHQLLVAGSDNFPAADGTRNQWVSHPVMLVDPRTWRVTRTFHGADRVEAVGDRGLYLEWRTTFRNGREVRRLAVTTATGRLLWQVRLRNAYPDLYGNRLIVSVGYGSHAKELDVRTGRLVRRLARWAPDRVIFWSRKHGMRVSPDRAI